jgi:hypothetical protein
MGPVAAKTLIVEGVVSPAWMERAGKREPLRTGMELSDKDRVITGPRARAMLRMSEGSAVKLGENASLSFFSRSLKPRQFFRGALDVAAGAFRFTTRFFGAPRAKRDLNIRIITITAGIRGTDLWGKGTKERDVVCLIEGSIDVEHRGEKIAMRDPLSFLIAPREGNRQPVAPVPAAQLKEWAAETDIAPASGASRRGGTHRVVTAAAVEESVAMSGAERRTSSGSSTMFRKIPKWSRMILAAWDRASMGRRAPDVQISKVRLS